MSFEAIQKYQNEYQRRAGRQEQLDAEIVKSDQRCSEFILKARYCEEAQLIIQNVAQITQKELEFHVGELVTLAMAAVFKKNPYSLIVDFVQRRGRTEADLLFERHGKTIDPEDSSGGGAVDVAAFALRVALWSLAVDKTRRTLILDEPLKWLKGGDLPEKGARMIKEISEKLGLQIIMISHIPDQIEGADHCINVSLVDDVSQITYT